MYALALKGLAAATSALGGFIPGLGSIGHALKVASYILVLGLGAWGGGSVINWWHSDKITVAESNERCADAISVATLEARTEALNEKEAALAERAVQVELDESLLKIAIEKMEKDRAESAGAGGDGVLVRADDEWLQRWRGNDPAAGGGRGRPGGHALPRAGAKGPR